MSSYTFQFFCGPDAATAMSTATSAAAKKAAAPKPAPAPVPMLPPPRPRPSSAPPMRPVMGRARSRSSTRAESSMPTASLAAPPGQWTPSAPAVTAPPGSWHAPPSLRMPHRTPRPGQPQFVGYPPQAVASPATSAPGLAGPSVHPHHRRPVTPPKAGRGRSPSQHRRRRRRKGDRSRRPRHAEEAPPAEVRPAEVLPAAVPAQASDAVPPPAAERDEKAMFQLVLRSNRDELSRQLHQAIGDHDATAFLKTDCRPSKPTCCSFFITWRTI